MYYLKRLKGFLINYFSTQKKSIITTTPIFLTIDRSNNTEAVCENIKRYFSEMSIRVKKQITEENIAIYIQEHNKTIIEKAKKWKIPFVEDNINFFALADEVDNYEYLLAKAKDEYNIFWDVSKYNPVALKKEIKYWERIKQEEHIKETRDNYSDYYASRGC